MHIHPLLRESIAHRILSLLEYLSAIGFVGICLFWLCLRGLGL